MPVLVNTGEVNNGNRTVADGGQGQVQDTDNNDIVEDKDNGKDVGGQDTDNNDIVEDKDNGKDVGGLATDNVDKDNGKDEWSRHW